MLLCIFKTGVYSLIDNGDSAQQIYSRTKPFSTHLISFFSTRRTSLAFGYRFERWFCLIFHRFAFYVTVRTFELFFFLFSLRHSYIKCRSTAKTKLASLLAHRLETFHFKFPPYKSRVPACLSRSKVCLSLSVSHSLAVLFSRPYQYTKRVLYTSELVYSEAKPTTTLNFILKYIWAEADTSPVTSRSAIFKTENPPLALKVRRPREVFYSSHFIAAKKYCFRLLVLMAKYDEKRRWQN